MERCGSSPPRARMTIVDVSVPIHDGMTVYRGSPAVRIGRGVALVGIDYVSIEGYGVPGAPTHKRLLGAGIPIVEGLDLFRVRPGRWQLVALPLRIANGDAGLTRAVLWRT